VADKPRGIIVPVVFDEENLAIDLRGLPDTATAALRDVRTQAERQGGVPYERLAACHSEARDGTDLAGCVKTYVPWPTGPWGIVFQAGVDPKRPFALYTLAYGRRHPSTGRRATVYQIAHRRLHEQA
jgi:hypothetical protein